MTEQQFAELKERIKAEVKEELKAEKEAKRAVAANWYDLKEYATQKLNKAVPGIDTFKRCAFQNGLSGLVRPLLGVRRIAEIDKSQTELAKKMVDKIFECVEG